MSLFTTEELKVAKVTGDDLPELLSVYKACEDFLALGPDPRASVDMIEKDLADSRKEAGEYCTIRNSEGALIGVIDIILKALEPSTCYLMLLMIGKPWRNRGYGRMVMVALEEYLREQYGSKQLDAEVQTTNPKAIHFWKSFGFQISEMAEDQPDGTVTYAMTKEL
jgi:ribosomal protein S18 acetylase RimI-like enzyme